VGIKRATFGTGATLEEHGALSVRHFAPQLAF
jgi:hypothetical protein